MKYFLLLFLLCSFSFADLQLKINSKAQDACYLKNPTNGLTSSDYSPVITGQTLIQTYTTDNCDSWNLNPYVNVDNELFKVIADLSCTETTSDTGTTSAEIEQYSLDVDCQVACDVPRSSDGTLYEQVANINETDCTNQNLQTMLDNYYPNQGYIADDTQYLTCTSNINLQGCYLKYHIGFDGNIDTNSTDTNTTDANSTLPDSNATSYPVDNNTTGDLLETNQKLDDLNENLKTNTDKIEELGTKLDTNGQKIDTNGLKIDAVRDSVINTGNYLGSKLDSLGDSFTNELKFQGDRLHDDLNDLKNLQSQPADNNISIAFDFKDIIDAIHKNTAEINRSIEMDRDKVNELFDDFDTVKEVVDNYATMTNDLKTSLSDIKSSFTDVYTPNFQHYNSCTFTFKFMNSSIPVDLCQKVSFLRPIVIFLLTIYFLVLVVRLHLYFISKLIIKYG